MGNGQKQVHRLAAKLAAVFTAFALMVCLCPVDAYANTNLNDGKDAVVLFRDKSNGGQYCYGNFYYQIYQGEPEYPFQEYIYMLYGMASSNSKDVMTINYYGPDGYFFGDWDGDGSDEIGIRLWSGTYYLMHSYLSLGYSRVQRIIMYCGRNTDDFLFGDWDGDGKDTICLRRGNKYYFFFDSDYKSEGIAEYVTTFGRDSDEVVAGDWDGDGIDTLAVVRNQTTVYFQQSSVYSQETKAWRFPSSVGDYNTILAGDWNGDGEDTLWFRVGNHFYYSYKFGSGYTLLDGGTFGRETDKAYAVKF